jgi:hypothetical protein
MAASSNADGDDMSAAKARTGGLTELRIGIFLFAVAAVVLALLGGCRTFSQEDVQLIKVGIAVNEAHFNDPRLSADAHAVARDAADAFHVLRYSADGTPVPPDVEARLAKDED